MKARKIRVGTKLYTEETLIELGKRWLKKAEQGKLYMKRHHAKIQADPILKAKFARKRRLAVRRRYWSDPEFRRRKIQLSRESFQRTRGSR